jgi:hypothetical protein
MAPSNTEEKKPRDPSEILQGWPGYRTRAGRSGLDPIDNDTEAGHMAGVFLRSILTTSYITRRPLALFLLAVFGILFTAPLALALVTFFQGSAFDIRGWIMVTILGMFGLVLLTNLFRNLFARR